MKQLLYPSMQKFYSALKSLDSFNKEKDFFENISSLDTFFSEFRNITFVLQKSLAHTEYESIYEKLRSRHLVDCKWFIEKRNETIKQHPFRLVKEIELTIFLPEQSFKVSTMRFTVENDINMSTLIEQFEKLFVRINPIEVYFSAEFSFYESGSDLDIYDEICKGISKMTCFLQDIKSELNQNCELCDKIEQEIQGICFSTIPRDLFLINDYVYYPQKHEFEKASRLAMIAGKHRVTLPRMPLEHFNKGAFKDIGTNDFEKFVIMHVSIGSSDLMPTRMIIYQDDTFELDTFQSDIKTTVYRKINETAKIIANNNVKEVLWMQTYLSCPLLSNMQITSVKERAKLATEEFLTFMKVDYALNEEEIAFESTHINCMNYIANQFQHSFGKELEFGRNNMMPIIKAFKDKQKVDQ